MIDKINDKLALISLVVIGFVVKSFKLIVLILLYLLKYVFKTGERIVINLITIGIIIFIIVFFRNEIINFIF